MCLLNEETGICAGCYMVFLDLTWHYSSGSLLPCPPKACRDLFEQRVCGGRNLLTHSFLMLELRRVPCLNLCRGGSLSGCVEWWLAERLWWWAGWRRCLLEESLFERCFGFVGMAMPVTLEVNWRTRAQSTKCNVLTPVLAWFICVQ